MCKERIRISDKDRRLGQKKALLHKEQDDLIKANIFKFIIIKDKDK